MKAVILAAGKGTRMQPLTSTRSKGMIPVAGRPILDWTCDTLGFCDEIILVANMSQKDIIEHFSKNDKVTLIFQDRPLGTGDALLQAAGRIKGKFIAIYGDDIYGRGDVEDISKKDAITVGTYVHEHPERFGIYTFKDGTITGLEEKPASPKSNVVNCGLYVFDERIFVALNKISISSRGEYELTDAIRLLIAQGSVKEHRVSDWIPLSYPWNILDANKYLLDRCGSQIHSLAVIRPGAVIEEPVHIAEGSVIGPNCFIRKYSSIGKNCKVGQAVEIKNSIVMENTFVSHLSYVGDSIIGSSCNVGCGAIFANLRLDEKSVKMEINGARIDTEKRKLGAIVGDRVKMGVRVTVMPGKRIWPSILVPACMTVEDDVKTDLPLSKYDHITKNSKIHSFIEE